MLKGSLKNEVTEKEIPMEDIQYLRTFGLTDTGKQRRANEDALLTLPERNLYIVADGMGGHNAGELASKMAVGALREFLDEERLASCKGKKDATRAVLEEAFYLANRNINDAAEQNPEQTGMGTALIVALVDGNQLHVCHVGDVRAYLLRRARPLEQITTDHSVVMQLVLAGKLTKEEARLSPMKNQMTQAVGVIKTIIPEYHTLALDEGDVLMLCSDGLWDMLPDREIERIMAEGRDARRISEALVQWANHCGGEDNISVITVIHQTTGSDTMGG
jgi:protein phosphatase